VVRRGRTPAARNHGWNQAARRGGCQAAGEQRHRRLKRDPAGQPEVAQNPGPRRQAPREMSSSQEQRPGDRLATWKSPVAGARPCLGPPRTALAMKRVASLPQAG
jgi:hypothetical protein